jgi:hypothetical protein
MGVLLLAALSGCASTRYGEEKFADSRSETCPENLEQGLRLTAFSQPLKSAHTSEGGGLQRRVVISAAPLYAQAGTRIVWSRLSLRTLGGNFTSWTRLKTTRTLLDSDTSKPPSKRDQRDPLNELAAVDFSSGQIIVLRSTQTGANLGGAVVLDIMLVPGGVPVDETFLRVPKLWKSREQPLAGDELQVELLPTRHPPGFDGIEGLIDFNYVVQSRRLRQEWLCAAEAHIMLVDRDAVRPPYWDLGISELNGNRKYWLALFDESHGAFRAMFESPAAANAFASWIRASGATKAGPYTLGLFDGTKPKTLRPFVPVDKTVLETFQPLVPGEAKDLRAGPLGEP